MGATSRIQSIYHMMDAKGIFDENPANAGARNGDGQSIYKKVEYPKMLYHPTGEQRVVDPGTEEFVAGRGLVVSNRKLELIYITVESAEEEAEALAKGWKKTPRESMGMQPGVSAESLPPESPGDIIERQARELEELKAQLAAQSAPPKPTTHVAHSPKAAN